MKIKTAITISIEDIVSENFTDEQVERMESAIQTLRDIVSEVDKVSEAKSSRGWSKSLNEVEAEHALLAAARKSAKPAKPAKPACTAEQLDDYEYQFEDDATELLEALATDTQGFIKEEKSLNESRKQAKKEWKL